MGVIMGKVNLTACASADATNVYDIGRNEHPGGSLDNPRFLYAIVEPGVGQAGTNGRWHSATFSWDGEVIILGWEPGGGAEPECQSTDPDVDKSAFFYDAHTGAVRLAPSYPRTSLMCTKPSTRRVARCTTGNRDRPVRVDSTSSEAGETSCATVATCDHGRNASSAVRWPSASAPVIRACSSASSRTSETSAAS
jgi:hypothetical protein